MLEHGVEFCFLVMSDGVAVIYVGSTGQVRVRWIPRNFVVGVVGIGVFWRRVGVVVGFFLLGKRLYVLILRD